EAYKKVGDRVGLLHLSRITLRRAQGTSACVRICSPELNDGKIVLPCRPRFPPRVRSSFPDPFGAGLASVPAMPLMPTSRQDALSRPRSKRLLGRRRSLLIRSPDFRS